MELVANWLRSASELDSVMKFGFNGDDRNTAIKPRYGNGDKVTIIPRDWGQLTIAGIPR